MIAIEVSDTGFGMDAETVERMFEPFFTTKRTGEGTGLGLSQVYGFASQSGGEVRCISAPGQGTTVSLLLPCSDAPVTAKASALETVFDHQPARILVVEDNEDVGAFAEALLTELGHSIARARSAEEALDVLRSQQFDLVFSDIVMPGMGGLKLAEQLARDKPDLPVVLATGYSQQMAQSGTGGRPVILKPYRLAALAEAIAAALQPQPAA
jgi:CheY-like chemotaxis protein